MYQLHTEKQRMYFSEVIRLHYKEGMGEERISRLLPIGHTTVSRWIAIFAKEKGKILGVKEKKKSQSVEPVEGQNADVESLQKRVKELEKQLLQAEVKAEFYAKMIDVAEAKFNIAIRKKSGVKQ